MKGKKILLLVLVILFSLSINSVWALEAEEGWTLLESNSISVPSDKLQVFEEKLAYRVNELNKLNLDKVYRYRLETNNDNALDNYLDISNNKNFTSEEDALIWANANKLINEGWSFISNIIEAFKVDKVLDLIRLETKEEVDAKTSDFINSADENSTEITITEIRDEEDDITEVIENTYKYDTFEDAYNASLELMDSTHDYIVKVKVIQGEKEYVKTETSTINSIFDNREEVLEYITSLENAGYTIEYEIKEINELSTLDKIYETSDEATKALEEFLKDYPETTITNIEELRDTEGDTTVKVENDYIFNSKEEADAKAEELKENEHYYVVTVNVTEEEPAYVETITESFSTTFKTETAASNYITSLENAGYTVEYEIKEINELSNLDKIYETSDEATKALEEFLKDYPETTITNIEELRDTEGDTTVKVENTYKFDTFEKAYNASLELIENNHDYIVNVNVYTGEPELIDTDIITLNKTFKSREEANNYITHLENTGYTVTYEIEEINELSTLNKTYNTYEEAREALEEFKTTLKELTSSNIEQFRDTTEDTVITTTGTDEYTTYEEAQNVANTLNENSNNYQVVATIREGNKNVVVGPTNIESEQFNTYEEALTYIDNLKNQGYDVSGLEIELIPFEESIWGEDEDVEVNPGEDDDSKFTYNHFDITLITNFTKIDTLGNKTTVTGSIAISDVKIANKDIVMEGPSIDPNEGYTEYTSEERHRLNITEESKVEISGTVTYFDPDTKSEKTLPFTVSGYLSESQNVCGGKGNAKGFDLKFESVTIINNKVVIDSNIISKYKVTGTITKNEITPVYYVDTTRTTYGYDYSVSASGVKLVGHQVTGTGIKNTYKDVYLLDINKTTLDYDYRVTANGVKFIEYLVSGTKAKDIYQDVYTLDINKTTLDYDYKVTANGVKFIEYLVNGTKAKDIYQDVYTLDINKTTLDYDYKVTANGVKFIGYQVNGSASKDIYKDTYLLDITKTMLDYDYEVTGTGIKTHYDVISKYVRLDNVNYLIEYMELGKGGDAEVLPPQTGVESNYSLFNIIISVMISLYIAIKSII